MGSLAEFLTENLVGILGIYYIIINIVAFIMYGVDKKKAKDNKFRIPEKVLILMAALGGGLGAVLGMRSFHHKTKKLKFKLLVPLFFILHLVIIVLISKYC